MKAYRKGDLAIRNRSYLEWEVIIWRVHPPRTECSMPSAFRHRLGQIRPVSASAWRCSTYILRPHRVQISNRRHPRSDLEYYHLPFVRHASGLLAPTLETESRDVALCEPGLDFSPTSNACTNEPDPTSFVFGDTAYALDVLCIAITPSSNN